MNNALAFPRINFALCVAAAAIVLSLALLPGFGASRLGNVSAPAAQVSEARLAKGTEGLLRQTAEHLSKMESGKSVGGFPGFEPPKDDKEYQRKVKERDYNAQDINDWVKEINNFLSQIVKKNRGMSLERILQIQGLTPSQIDEFVEALRNAQSTAAGMSGHGVSATTAKTLESLMSILGVSTW